jgi:protease I
VRDGNLITSRLPNDLPDFCREIKKAIEELPERSTHDHATHDNASSSANYTSAAKVKTGAVAAGSANYLMYAARGE